MSYIRDKVIIVTGAGSGFGRLISQKAAAMGAKLVCADISVAMLDDVVQSISAAGGIAMAVGADVTDVDQMRVAAATAVKRFGRIDVLVNNAGTMPLAFIQDHEAALPAWDKCIDINFKGVMNGTVAVYDQMIQQGQGQIINISSIYGNHPVVGAAVYGATKAAVNYFSNSVRVESRGKIKVCLIKPTGVPATGLTNTVVNAASIVGIVGQNAQEFQEFAAKYASGELPPSTLDPEAIGYPALDPVYIADAVIHVINQPAGIALSDVTVRAAGDPYIL